jgi:serine/threonine protein kinase
MAGLQSQPFEDAFDKPKELGTCARGTLYRVRERGSGQKRLVWRLPQGVEPSGEQLDAFLEDATKVRALSLRQALHMLWLGRDEDGVYAVYEDFAGEPLLARIAGDGFDRMGAARVAKQLAVALKEIHDAEVHVRELRPELVFVDGEQNVAMLGVGLLRLVEPPSENVPDPGGDKAIAPERRRKTDRADVRGDLFGLGVLMILMLTGELPTGREPKELPDVPGAMATFLKKTLAPATGMRYIDASKSFRDLDRCPGAKGFDVVTAR